LKGFEILQRQQWLGSGIQEGAFPMLESQNDESGYCVICGRHSSFRFDPSIIIRQLQKVWAISDNLVEAFNRRESMFCGHCGSSLRVRRLAAVLIETLFEKTGRSYKSVQELLTDDEFRHLKIAEINACGGLHSYLKNHPNLYYSEWVPHAKPGEVHDGVRCEDLQCLTYPDDCFDIILTSETLQHVPNPDKAWHEIYRTLKDGGYHIFTIPIVPSQWQTIQRAQFVDGARRDVLEPAYHGDWGREDVFVYTDFGMDVVETLDKMNLSTKIFYSVPQVELDVAMVVRSLKNGGQSDVPTKPASPLLEWTGERYLPWLEEATIGYEHLHRYAYATAFADGKRVLDLACGEGYGSHLLSRTANHVVGIDIDADAVRHASNKYLRKNLEFKIGSITEVPLEGQSLFDVIVCFEALEHIADHHALLKEIKRLLTPDGVFIVSTPNKWAYSDEPQYTNPFHVHELYFDEFSEVLRKYFKRVKMLGQRVYCNSQIWPVFSSGNSDLIEYVMEKNSTKFDFVEIDKKIPLYFIALASNVEEELNERTSILVDNSNELLRQNAGAVSSLVAARDRLELTVKAQQHVVAERDQRLSQLMAERDQQLRQLVAERDRLADEKTQMEARLSEMMAERTKFARESDHLQDILHLQTEELVAIKDTIGWRVLSQYRTVRERFGLIKSLHGFLTEPLKRIYQKKNNPNDVITSTPAGVSPISGSADRVSNQLPSFLSASGMTGVPEVQKDLFRRVRRQSKNGSGGTVLFLADWLPAFDQSGGALRTFNMLQILCEGGHNLVFGANRDQSAHVYFFGSEEDVKKYEHALEELKIGVLYGYQEILRYLTEEGEDCRFVILSFPEVACRYFPSVRAYAINAKVIYDPVDLHWLRMQRESEIKHDDALRKKAEGYRRMERFNAAAADIVFAVTHEEKTRILEDVSNAKVEVIPTIHSPVDKVKPAAERKNLLFVGHYAHTPNEDAVSYFVQDIFPLIRKELRGVIFYVVGSHITEKVKSLAAPDVVAIGYVPDLSPYLDDCRIFVAPLRYGAGIKAKIGQSMSFGLPVVTTSLGAEGMNLTSGKNVVIADSPAEFASAVVRLYTDDLFWEEMSSNSLEHIKMHFSPLVVQRKLKEVFSPSDDLRSPVAEVG